jgi:hypothetical protein
MHTQNGRGEIFSSNAVRLSVREWSVLSGILAVAVLFSGEVWKRVESFDPPSDYRIPFGLSEDYWLFDRFCGEMKEEEKTLVFGDSFVWGQYVNGDQTLTHFLNQQAGSERFANAGLDGAHPLAMAGLLRHHCPDLRDAEVILHLNLLWLSSPQADLQIDREFHFNHPRLVPQISPRIPAYRESVSGRIGIIVGRYLPVFNWIRHLRSIHLEGAGLAQWTLENPYENPLGQKDLNPPASVDEAHVDAEAWFIRGRSQQELPWVDLDTSLQWRAFQGLVQRLQARGNRVIVLVGPLNEHMLGPASRDSYRGLLGGAERWLTENEITYFLPQTLPSELYGDLSHPLSDGYALLAGELWKRMFAVGRS